jgi:hypothetical protein
LSVLAATLFAASPALSAEPGALLSRAGWQFDPVPEGTVVTHEIPIRNPGSAPLEIAAVRTG